MGDKKMMPVMIVMILIMLSSIIFTVQGIGMHNQVDVEETNFHALQASYWSQEKQIRDSAATDSDLNNQLVLIKNYPSILLQLKLVGVGKILTGIFILLFGILIALIMMPVRLAKEIRKHNGQM